MHAATIGESPAPPPDTRAARVRAAPAAPPAASAAPPVGLVLEALPGAVVVLDRSGKVSQSNAAARELLGDDLDGRHWPAVVGEHFVMGVGPDARTRDGRLLSISTRALQGQPGQVVLLNDVTHTRELEQRLRRMQRFAETGSLFSSLAHQVRTPVSAALLDAANLRGSARAAGAASERAHQRLVARLRHLESLVEDLLSFARQGRMQVQTLSLQALLEAAAERLRPHVQDAGAELVLRVEEDALVQGSAEALGSALDNLVMNALQAGSAGVRVAFGLGRTRQGRVCLSVTDDGPGIPGAERERIFEPFYSTRERGTGLGLAITRAIVEAHGATLQVQSATGVGTRFELEMSAVGGDRG